jgi:hypothetical protein
MSAVVLYFAIVADVSIASLNLSLLVNSVGFYQVGAAASVHGRAWRHSNTASTTIQQGIVAQWRAEEFNFKALIQSKTSFFKVCV